MTQLSPSLGASPSSGWLKTPIYQPITTPEKIWNTLSPERNEMVRKKLEQRRQRQRERILQEATPEELVRIPRARLIRTLARQKLVLTVQEMAALSGFDLETIRRRVKDGTLPKVPRVRIIHVYYHNFLRWLQGEPRAI
jgi:predicted DNA-binding transcriptional regulator AlpA